MWVEDDPDAPTATPSRKRPMPRGKGAKSPAAPTAAKPPRPRKKLPRAVVLEVAEEAGSVRAARFTQLLAEATKAYDHDRYQEALFPLKRLRDAAPAMSSARELLGLCFYRLGRWGEAAKELEAFRELSGSYDQHPTLADCYRARKRWAKVNELWDDLREASPGADLVAEGRIVAAGALADQGNVAGAIELLEAGRTSVKRPQAHHLRLWYALGDLYERAGEIPRARELFRRVAAADPDLADVAQRVAALR